MQSDPGAGVPHTGGDDDAVWRDLVARLEEPDDDFLGGPDTPTATGPAMEGPVADRTDADGPVAKGKALADGGAGTPISPSAPGTSGPEPKTVTDFDPLGVWGRQAAPAPHEPAADDYRHAPATPPTGPRDYEADDDEGEFVPEELPSLSTADPAIMASWIGAAGGPLFLVFSAIFWRHVPMLLVIGVVLAFVAGTGYLLYRLPNHRDHDSGDGAVV